MLGMNIPITEEKAEKVIKNQAKNISGQTQASKIDNFEIAKNAIIDLDSQLKQFYANGGKTNIFSGNYEKTINNLGSLNDPKLVSLATQIAASLQIYRNAVSGTAYSEQEGKDIASIFPGINKTQGLNNAIIKGRMAAFDSVIDGAYRNVLGNSYDTLKKLETNNQSSQQTQSSTQILDNIISGDQESGSGFWDNFLNLFGLTTKK
jgi:hypothetical protein